MKPTKWFNATILACFILTVLAAVWTATANAQSKIRIGTYDSRSVALAFYRADNMKTMQDFIRNLNAELNKAREAKDEKKVKELEAKGPAFQNLMHQQVFGNLSIPNVMTTIKDQLPTIAQKVGVTLIISKWEIQGFESGIELIDLTQQLVELFHVDDTTRKMTQEIRSQEPVPIDQLLNPND
jgi:hypothetical protein